MGMDGMGGVLPPEDQSRDHDNDEKNKKKNNRVIHQYASCLACLTGSHELCTRAQGGWVTQGKRRYWSTECACAENGHQAQ